MRRELKKYYTKNFGSFTPLNDSELNTLLMYGDNCFNIEGVLFSKKNYKNPSQLNHLSHAELVTILYTFLNDSLN